MPYMIAVSLEMSDEPKIRCNNTCYFKLTCCVNTYFEYNIIINGIKMFTTIRFIVTAFVVRYKG